MGNFLTTMVGYCIEAAYAGTGTIDPGITGTEARATIEKQVGVKLLMIKGISQDLGEKAAVAFLQANDSVLGPVAQDVVDTVNGNASDAVSVVMGLLAES